MNDLTAAERRAERQAWWAIVVVFACGLAFVAWISLDKVVDSSVKSAAANTALTTVLVAVTIAYAFLTAQIAQASRATALEAKAQREAGLRPVVVFDLDQGVPLSNLSVPLLVKNFGPGPAIQVHVVLSTKPAPDHALPPDEAAARRKAGRGGVNMALPADPSTPWLQHLPGPDVAAALARGDVCLLSAVYDDAFGTCWDTRTPLEYRHDTKDAATTGPPVIECLPARPDTKRT